MNRGLIEGMMGQERGDLYIVYSVYYAASPMAQQVQNMPAGDAGSIPGLGRSPGGGNGNPLQHSCLKNPMDRGAQQVTVHGVAKSQT